MQRKLSQYAVGLLGRGNGVPIPEDVPLLVWSNTEAEDEEELYFSTAAGQLQARPTQGEPLVFELRKRAKNPLTMGITVGRTENNDVVIDDKSISRFHAYFQQDPRSHLWKVVDAESSNGSFLDGKKLEPNKARELGEDIQLRFGDVAVRFFVPAAFRVYLRQSLGG